MKNQYEKDDHFPEKQVRTAIQLGVAKAVVEKEQGNQAKKRNKIRTSIYVLCSIAAAFIILLGISYQSPVVASNLSKIPIIGSVFGDSDLIGLQQAQEKGLTNQIGETKTINGVSVTLEEVLYDKNNITIGLKMESEEALDDAYFSSGIDFTIDGRVPSSGSGSYGEEILSPTSRTAIETISVTDEMPSEFDLGLLVQGENGEKWYFSTPVNQANDIETIPVQHEETIEGIELNVTEFAYGASGASISFNSVEDAKLVDEGRDRASWIEFKMEDQDGNEIKSHSGGVTGERVKEDMIYTSNKKFDPLDSDVTEVTITPYLALPTDGGGVEFDEDGNEEEIEFKQDARQPVEFNSFKVKITP